MGSESIEAVTLPNSSSSSREKFFPPGFRFHPTDEELILYYLKRKICGRSLKLDIIGEVDVYKWDPEELPGQSKWNTGDREWFFFYPRDKKYPNGGRSSRGTMNGYWKATGKDRIIKCNSRTVGSKKTLIYYKGRTASGVRTDWVMHEYNLNEDELKRCKRIQDFFALYKVFKKSGRGPKNGEQYGAPFVEEEWADDDCCLDLDPVLVQSVKALMEDEPKPPDNNPVNGGQTSLIVCPSSQVDTGPSQNQLAVQPGADPGPSAAVKPYEIQLGPRDDFLEIDDLISPLPGFENSEPILLDNLQFSDFDGFCEFDFYNEINSFESQQHVDHQNNDNLTTEETQAASTSGLCGEDDGTDSWFSSVLWAFVESVPSGPASALESSALLNKAIEQIPNFSIINGGGGSSSVESTKKVLRLRSRSRSIVYISVFGVFLAIICVVLAFSIEVFRRCVMKGWD